MPIEVVEKGERRFVIVGTAHVSDESVKDVEEAITKYEPDAVAVELCQQRHEALKNKKGWEELEIGKVISSDKIYLLLLQILLGNFQRRIGEDLGVKPGAEMMKAMEVAEEKGIPVILADRDIKITLKRALEMMSLWEKAKILTGLFSGMFEGEEIDEELVEKLKNKDVLTEVLEELAVETPSVKRVLVDERDEFIANSIFASDAKTVVAVVGAGHMAGIIRILEGFAEDAKLVKITRKIPAGMSGGTAGKRIKLISYAVPAIFVALIAYGFFQKGADVTANMLVKWFLINGVLSALGVALARGHIASVLTAFVAAPFTSLNPAIAAGWVAGYVELRLRKPRVSDFKGLMNLKSSSDYLSNRVSRVVIIVAAANIGSTIGTLVALPYLATLL